MIPLKIDISSILAVSAPEILSNYNIDLNEVSLYYENVNSLNINVQNVAQNIKVYLLEWYTDLRKATPVEINKDLKDIFEILNNSTLSLIRIESSSETIYKLNHTPKILLQSVEPVESVSIESILPPTGFVVSNSIEELTDEELVSWIDDSNKNTIKGIGVLQGRLESKLDVIIELANEIKEGAEQARQQNERPTSLKDYQDVIATTVIKTEQLQSLTAALQKFGVCS